MVDLILTLWTTYGSAAVYSTVIVAGVLAAHWVAAWLDAERRAWRPGLPEEDRSMRDAEGE